MLALIGAWPLATLGAKTPARTWMLAGTAVVLGALLALWLWRRQMLLLHSGIGRGRSRARSAGAGALVIGIGLTPTGVRMIYSAALEGVVWALAVIAVRAWLSDRGSTR